MRAFIKKGEPYNVRATALLGRIRLTRSLGIMVLAALLQTGCSHTVPIADAQVSIDGERLELILDSCNADLTHALSENAEEVAIAVERSKPLSTLFASGDCQDALLVQLDEPLGDRRVVDVGTGREIAVSDSAGVTWPYDRGRVSEDEYEAALERMVACLEERDPQVSARIEQGLNWAVYEWSKPADDEGNVSTDAPEPCESEHLEPLR